MTDLEEDVYTNEEKFHRARVILVCYPKAGSSWIQTMAAQYLDGRYGSTMKSVKHLFMRTLQVPAVEPTLRTHDDGPHLKPVEEFEQDKSRYRDKKVMLLVRDPRDVVVSYYFWVRQGREARWRGEPFRGSADEFVHSPVGGLRTVIAFYNVWARHRDVPRDCMLLRYEQVRVDTLGEMRRMLAFMGEREASVPHLERAIAFGSFDNMRRLEDANTPGLDRPGHVRNGEYEGYKMRRGVIGGYVDYLRPATIEEMNRIIDGELSDDYVFYKTGGGRAQVARQ